MPGQHTMTLEKKEMLFKAFKYTVYVLLFLNIFYWLREDYLASAHIYRGTISFAQIGDAFAQAVDTFAWFVLLIALELETSIISDEKLNKGWKWVLNGVAGLCYALIVFSFLGYITKMQFVLGFSPISAADGCAAMGDYLSFAEDLDQYVTLTADNCNTVAGTLFGSIDTGIIADTAVHQHLIWMAVIEVVNASAWILVVLLLWVDLFMQLRAIEQGPLYRINYACKVLLYLTLLAACIFWGFYGDFMDFWDAFLWIAAFFFIELNIFQWSEEVHESNAAKATNITEKTL